MASIVNIQVNGQAWESELYILKNGKLNPSYATAGGEFLPMGLMSNNWPMGPGTLTYNTNYIDIDIRNGSMDKITYGFVTNAKVNLANYTKMYITTEKQTRTNTWQADFMFVGLSDANDCTKNTSNNFSASSHSYGAWLFSPEDGPIVMPSNPIRNYWAYGAGNIMDNNGTHSSTYGTLYFADAISDVLLPNTAGVQKSVMLKLPNFDSSRGGTSFYVSISVPQSECKVYSIWFE